AGARRAREGRGGGGGRARRRAGERPRGLRAGDDGAKPPPHTGGARAAPGAGSLGRRGRAGALEEAHSDDVSHAEATMSDLTLRARGFLAGTALTFDDADRLWKALKKADEISPARRVLERLRDGKGLIDERPTDRKTRQKLCQQEALLTSKDAELSTTVRHDRALDILTEEFGDLDDPTLDGDAETLGIAGGIRKRRWVDLGQVEDARRAARRYGGGAGTALGEAGYTHVNAAFMQDMLPQIGDDPAVCRERAARLRERILKDLPALEKVSADGAWFNTATRAEALFGLRRYA